MRRPVTCTLRGELVQSPGPQVDTTPADVGPPVVDVVVVRCPECTAVRSALKGMLVAQPDALQEHPADQRS